MKQAEEVMLEEQEAAPRSLPLKRVHLGIFVFYLLAMLLNGNALLDDAKLLKYGRWRDICVAIARPMAYLSSVTRLSYPREYLEKWTTHEDHLL